MLLRSYFLLPALLAAQLALAQNGPERTLRLLFDGMRAADTTGMQALFHPAADLHSVSTDATGRASVVRGDLNRWMSGIAGARPGALDEQLHYTAIRREAGLATAWTPYTFVLNGQISHCGTNAFQLVQDGSDGRWRILNIVDTRRNTDCTPADTVSTVQRIDELATRWHAAASEADSASFFGPLTDDAVYIGTDPGEHWTKDEFLAFAAPYFAAGKAWSFTATERHVFFDESQDVAYWEELLDTWMGPCRGTGIVRRAADGNWKIGHYTLSVAVPNDKIQPYLDLLGDAD